MKARSSLPLVALLPALAACTAVPKVSEPARQGATAAPRPAIPATDPVTPAPGFIAPKVMREAGLSGIIGQDAGSIERLFGKPRLRTPEGDALKMQFSGRSCVLDVYLYPLRPGSAPVATHVEARRASDAVDVDRAACVAALKR